MVILEFTFMNIWDSHPLIKISSLPLESYECIHPRVSQIKEFDSTTPSGNSSKNYLEDLTNQEVIEVNLVCASRMEEDQRCAHSNLSYPLWLVDTQCLSIPLTTLHIKKIRRFLPWVAKSMNKIKKYTNFRRESGKLAIQIKDDYYINGKPFK